MRGILHFESMFGNSSGMQVLFPSPFQELAPSNRPRCPNSSPKIPRPPRLLVGHCWLFFRSAAEQPTCRSVMAQTNTLVLARVSTMMSCRQPMLTGLCCPPLMASNTTQEESGSSLIPRESQAVAHPRVTFPRLQKISRYAFACFDPRELGPVKVEVLPNHIPHDARQVPAA